MQKNLIIVIPISMVLGLLVGINWDAKPMQSLIVPLTFLMVYPMMVTLPLKKVFEGGDTKVQLTTQIINFAVVPFAAYGFGRIFFAGNEHMALGLLLVGLLPTSGMTISWTGMAKGNVAAAVKMTVFGLLLGSLLAPFYMKMLMGAKIEIDMMKIFSQIGIIVVIPMILGNLTQRALVAKYGMAHYQEKLKKIFPPFSTLGVVGVVFVAMALKAKGIMNNPSIVLAIFVPLLLFYSLNIILSIVVGKSLFGRFDAIALLYGTVMRNLSIALAIAMTAFGSKSADIAIVVALGYIIQVQLGAWVVRLTSRIYGPAPESEALQIMHLGLFAIDKFKTIKDAMLLLAEEHIHSLAVLDESQRPIGILCMDNVIDEIANDIPMDTPISNLKLKEPVFAGLHQHVSEIARIMKRKHEYKVMIMDEKGKVQGVVTPEDILEDKKQ